jgi:hypothetical protein
MSDVSGNGSGYKKPGWSIHSVLFHMDSCHLMWRRWSLWAALVICLAIHSLAIWAFFQYVLSDSQSIGFLLWSPISLVEVFVLFIAVNQIEDKLTGKKEPFVVD